MDRELPTTTDVQCGLTEVFQGVEPPFLNDWLNASRTALLSSLPLEPRQTKIKGIKCPSFCIIKPAQISHQLIKF